METELWKQSDGDAKQTFSNGSHHFWVMSYGNWVMSCGNWQTKQALKIFLFLYKRKIINELKQSPPNHSNFLSKLEIAFWQVHQFSLLKIHSTKHLKNVFSSFFSLLFFILFKIYSTKQALKRRNQVYNWLD